MHEQLEQALWPLLGLLLYATFTQIPLLLSCCSPCLA